MKYILAQNGHVYSVGQLMPPRKDPNVITFEVWALSLIVLGGQEHVYATYDNCGDAINAYNFVITFIRSSYSMLDFPMGHGSWAKIYEKRDLGLSDGLDGPVSKPYNPEETAGAPLGAKDDSTSSPESGAIDALSGVMETYGLDPNDPNGLNGMLEDELLLDGTPRGIDVSD